MKIYQAYEAETLDKIRENPYQLVKDVEGIGFIKADELGGRMGISGKHEERIKAAILYTVEATCLQEGHTYIETRQLIIETQKLLNQSAGDEKVTEMDVADAIISLGEQKSCSLKMKGVIIRPFTTLNKALPKGCRKSPDRPNTMTSFPNRNSCSL